MARGNSKQKYFRHPLFIAVVAFTILLSIFWLLVPKNKNSYTSQTAKSQNETANWKTYEGDGYGFKYPNDWKIESNDIYAILKSPDYGESSDDEIPVSGSDITILSGPATATSVWEEQDLNCSNNYSLPCPTPARSTPIDGVEAIRYETDYETRSITTRFIKDETYYVATIYFFARTGPNHDQYVMDDLPIYDQILSTFKFTK